MTTTDTAPSAQLIDWLEAEAVTFGLTPESLVRASADAGFRQYWRIQSGPSQSMIVMDASRETPESFAAFIKVERLMAEAGVRVPKIYRFSQEARYMLLEDLGHDTALSVVNEDNARAIFEKAIESLILWQKYSHPGVLPAYDREVLLRELNLFPEWYVRRHRGHEWSETESKWWQMSVEAILDNVLAQPQVFVHRDFMLRNLMLLGDGTLGVLDFQDALYGPLSYDIASLMRDAFISWNESFVLDMTIRYWERARKAAIPVPADFSDFYRDVEFMGAQRHLKVLGIFARLNYRDAKAKYLADTPRFIDYVRKTSQRYIALSPLSHLIDNLEGSQTQVGYTF